MPSVQDRLDCKSFDHYISKLIPGRIPTHHLFTDFKAASDKIIRGTLYAGKAVWKKA
jgi:hypothetical protein